MCIRDRGVPTTPRHHPVAVGSVVVLAPSATTEAHRGTRHRRANGVVAIRRFTTVLIITIGTEWRSPVGARRWCRHGGSSYPCLLYTSDAADDLLCVDLGGRRIIKKKKK
eukprot:TRINITY_DN10694_c0_g1_i1.p2 TRINITY_DN10694_c0_g1~~TRINITY_DN10694_c0_g1_i1.p2  ORF type:complete len:110 (-),score=32.67 TRINITY_DN10694_c0_g1_i1:128-457(-)